MDEPLLTLLTIAANTLITYFLLNRQEKRLEQKAFQQQVKFERNHEKEVETLQDLYQKYVAYFLAIVPLIEAIKISMENKRLLANLEYSQMHEAVNQKLEEFKNC